MTFSDVPGFLLRDDIKFPPPDHAHPSGLLAIGGDLSPQRLLLAYQSGIFPWYSESEPILWWSPDPRCVLYPEKLKIPKSMKPLLNKKAFTVTFDKSFRKVISGCMEILRPRQKGTWITDEMIEAYSRLHKMGYAHSVEVWKGDVLAGGLYGVSIGKCFFGESMFSRLSNASKYGFIAMVQKLKKHGFSMIDCQVKTGHLLRFGAEMIPRQLFLNEVKKLAPEKTLQGVWDSF